MSVSYTTKEYFRDSFSLFDLLFTFSSKSGKFIQNLTSKILNSDLDSLVFRVLENLPYGVFILFLGFFLVVGILRATETERGIKVYNIQTPSMTPSINPGSLLFSFPSTRYFSGDIVNYKEKSTKTNLYTGRVITHRITSVKIEDGFYVYTAKGDNNDYPDPGSIKTLDITGKVVVALPYLGYVDFLIQTVPGFLIFIGVPTILLIKEAKSYASQA